MNNEFQKLLELTLDRENYTEIITELNANNDKKKKTIKVLKELLGLLDEILFLFKGKPIITFVIKILIKRINKILDEMGVN